MLLHFWVWLFFVIWTISIIWGGWRVAPAPGPEGPARPLVYFGFYGPPVVFWLLMLVFCLTVAGNPVNALVR